MDKQVAFGLMTAVLIVAAVWDCRTHKVPNRLVYPAMLVGLAWWFVGGAMAGGEGWNTAAGVAALGDSAVSMLLAIFCFGVIFALGGLGGGDVKLMGVVGAMLADPDGLLIASVYAFVIGAALAVGMMIRKGLVKRTLGRIGHALLMASARVKTEMPADSPRVPFAVAICLGGILAGTEFLLGQRWPWSA